MKSEPERFGYREARAGSPTWTVTRRAFLKASPPIIAWLSVGGPFAHADEKEGKAKLRFGIVTDSHYADVATQGTRNYRASVAKMTECVALMNEQKVDSLVELGDLKDQGRSASEESTLKYIETIESVFGKFKGHRYHVLGNHDIDSISKEQFLARVENTDIAKESKYYSFDAKGAHFIVLDANYSADQSDYDHGKFKWTDANVSHQELDWLAKDLAATSKPVVAFVHQPLDGQDIHRVKNAAQVRAVLEKSQRVLAVFQGHNHAGNQSHIEGIHYYTLKAMVEGVGDENNSYAIVDVYDDGLIVVTGYRRAVSKKMAKA